MKSLSTLLLILALSSGIALRATPYQLPSDTIYFDKDWSAIKDPQQAVFYRIYKQLSTGTLVADFYAESNKPQMVGMAFSLHPLKFEGGVRWYYENGQLQKEANFNRGEKTGIEKTYRKDGTPESQLFHRDGERYTVQVWDGDGNALLVYGSGTVEEKDPESQELKFMTYQDSAIVESFSIRKVQQDTIYSVMDFTPEYNGGMRAFYAKVGEKMKYPVSARRLGIEGTVYVQFILDRNGGLQEMKVVKGISADCDQEVLRVVRKLTNWKPGRHNGRPVKARLVLPVIFKLS